MDFAIKSNGMGEAIDHAHSHGVGSGCASLTAQAGLTVWGIRGHRDGERMVIDVDVLIRGGRGIYTPSDHLWVACVA
jgi:hypothetical protein